MHPVAGRIHQGGLMAKLCRECQMPTALVNECICEPDDEPDPFAVRFQPPPDREAP